VRVQIAVKKSRRLLLEGCLFDIALVTVASSFSSRRTCWLRDSGDWRERHNAGDASTPLRVAAVAVLA